MAFMNVAEDEDDDLKWGWGMFQLLFASMGQGDCCVITCPDGAHIMVDCGCKGMEKEGLGNVRDIIRSRKVLGNRGITGIYADRLVALILTHPDEDHINQVEYIIGGRKDPIPIDEVYFSDRTDRKDFKKAPLLHYGGGKCSYSLFNYSKMKKLYCVTLRDGEQTLHQWEKQPFGEDQYSDQSNLIDDNRVTVRSGRIDAGTDWEVSIIAGNVLRDAAIDASDGDGKNAGSLVTLVRLGNERILICGDATRSTQDYLCQTFTGTKEIKRLAVLQVPHHGSSFTGSTAKFVSLVKPKWAVISARSEEHIHHLPGEDVIDAYLTNADDIEGGKSRRTQAWKSMGKDEFYELADKWKELKKQKKIAYKETLTRYSRTDVNADTTGPILLDGVNSYRSKYVLYQRPITKEIKLTGLDHHCWYYLP